MTSKQPASINYQDHLQRALADLLPDWNGGQVVDPLLASAGRIAADRFNKGHRTMHANAQRGGAIVWALREQKGMSWRAIYDATGIVQRTGARWMALFMAEGVTEQPAADLEQRLQVDPGEGGE